MNSIVGRKSSVPRIELLQRFDIVGSEEVFRKAARTIGVCCWLKRKGKTLLS